MIKALKALFEPLATGEEDEDSRLHRSHLAAAALLIETARADFTQSEEEQQALLPLLCDTLDLQRQEVLTLIEQASDKVDDAISLYEFTRVINDYYSPAQKLELVDCMWAVAYADGNLDKYEEHLIRSVAELTYVPHPHYIKSKLEAGKS